MRRVFGVVVIVAILIVAFAYLGGTLPEGNPLRDGTQFLRDFGDKVANGFGGGYPATFP